MFDQHPARPVRSRRTRSAWTVALVTLAAAVGVLGSASPAAAQPSDDLSSYVLFGFDELDFKGGQGNHGPSIIDGGNVGVNGIGFIRGNDYRLNICANAQVVMSDNTFVVSDTARMGDTSTPRQECDFHEAFVNTGARNNEDPRTGPAQPFTPPPIKATPDFPDYTCDPGNPLTVPAQGTATMTPGNYGAVTWQNGTTITLTAGTYTMCRITTGQHVTVITEPGVVLQVAQDFLINDDMAFDGSDCGTIPQVFVRGDEVGANNNAVRFGQDSEIWGHFYVPDDRLNLGNQTSLHGTFWARAIGSDFNVDVEYCPPPHPPPDTGDISVTKVLTGDVAGAPPNGTYRIHYNCEIPGPGVRNALDGAFDIVPGETLTFTGVQVGTTCVATEIDVPVPRPGYVFDPPVITPDTVVVGQPGQVVEVRVENPLRAAFGTIEVAKQISGDADGHVPGSVFGFALDCEDDTFDTTFDLEAGETFTSDPIHVRVPCTVTETSTPDARPGFVYDDPTFDPDPAVVRIAEENAVVRVQVDNPIRERGTGPDTGTDPDTGEVTVPTTVPAGVEGRVVPSRGPVALPPLLALVVGLALAHVARQIAARTRC